jgi:hypothetical protein
VGDAEYFVRVDNGEFALGCQRFISTGWNQWEVVEAAAGAPALSGASLPTNQTGPEVRARWGNAALPGLMHGRFAGQQRLCLADCLPDCQLACLSGCKTTNRTAQNCPPAAAPQQTPPFPAHPLPPCPQLVRDLLAKGKRYGFNTMRTWVHSVNPQYAMQVGPATGLPCLRLCRVLH